MPQKKESTPSLSSTEQDQVQLLLTDHRQIADHLHQSSNQTQIEDALSGVTALSESAQLTLIKALGRERDHAAADILLAINELGSLLGHKELRKEARRSLLRLQADKIVSSWKPPLVHTPAVQVTISNEPRYLRGFVTQAREEGEIQLLLCWEQGYDYSEARLVTLHLDFWKDGIKQVTAEVATRRRILDLVEDMRKDAVAGDLVLVDCTLAEGKRLLEEALSINVWRGSTPDASFTNHLPLLNKLILQATDLDEDRGRTFITPEMEDQEVVVNFLGAWSFGDFGLAYDLLTTDSSIRDHQTRDEWIECHRAWFQEARPTRMELGFVHIREQQHSALWLPTSASIRPSARKELEVGWSLELLDTPLSGTLTEMPMGTATNKETGRHWFWTDYILVRENAVWRIQQANDAGLALQGLSFTELQTRIKTYKEAVEKAKPQNDTTDQKMVQRYIEELSWRLNQILHFYDALLTILPLDYTLYEEAYNSAVLIGNPERVSAYLERTVQRFSQQRGENLRRLGAVLVNLAFKYEEPELLPRQQHLLERAKEYMLDALSIEDIAIGHILLAELFLSQERNDEAEAELLKVSTLHPTQEEEASVEAGLGHLAMRRERMAEALPHYQRVSAINPRYPGIWFNIGFAQRLLGQFSEAETSYLQSIQQETDDIRAYSELCALYVSRDEPEKARDLLQQALRANPQSAHLHALLASLLFEMGDQRSAQQHLEEAERLEPDLEIVQSVRQIQSASKKS